MSDYIHAQELTDGQLVFREGDQGDDAYIVEEGAVEISVGKGRRRRIIATLGPGEIFGEMALIANAPRSASATAVGKCVMLVLRRHRLMKPIERADPLTQLLLQMMTERLNEASKMMAGRKKRAPASEAHLNALEAVRDLALKRVSTERQLRRGIEAGEFMLHYQPIVRLSDGGFAGAEALMRWYQPENGFISPGEFIPLAEDTGMIIEMGDWALRQALNDHATFVRAHKKGAAGAKIPFISVNVSAAQLIDADETRRLADTIRSSDLDPGAVKLELTESLLMQDPDQAAKALATLKDTGAQLAIDDFGTGYSSLSYLHKFPFDTLKIDRAFVCRMREDNGALQLVRSIVEMAQGLGMDTVAEGIEEHEELELLGSMGCEMAQGFLMAKPMAAETLLVQLKTNSAGGWPSPPGEGTIKLAG
jgi:EAL domain-containing protein (putative c-di-GMP-specific phosphodiesterase class I)